VAENLLRETDALDAWAELARAALDAGAVVVEIQPGEDPGGDLVGADGLHIWDQSALPGLLEALAPNVEGSSATQIVDLALDPRTANAFPWGRTNCRSVISVPVSCDGAPVGTLHAIEPEPQPREPDWPTLIGLVKETALETAYGRLRTKTTRLSAELESVVMADKAVLEARTIEEMGHLLTTRLAAILGAQTGGVMVYDDERGALQTLPGAFGVSDDAAFSYRIQTDNPDSNCARVFRSGEPMVSNHAQGDPGIMQDYVDLFQVKRLLSIPLVLGGKKVGVLHLANKPAPFTEYDVYRAHMLAPRVATVVELGTAMLRLRRQQRATEVLVDLALRISSGDAIEDLIEGMLGQLGDVIEVSILALVPSKGAPLVWSRPDVPAALVEELVTDAAGRSSSSLSVGEPRQAGDPGSATYHVPVRLAGRQFATLSTLRRRADPFVENDREVLRRTANLIAVGRATEGYRRQRAEVAALRERQRIADDLHDHVAQLMYAAQVTLDSVLEEGDVAFEREVEIARARSLLLKGDVAIREVIHQLAEPIPADLRQRLELMAQELGKEFRATIRLEVPEAVAEATRELRRPAVEALVRTAREAVVNAIKHAGPCSIAIRLDLSADGRLLLTVADDGAGHPADSSHKGHGLDSLRRVMRDCGGQLRVSTVAQGGTRVMASVPL